MLKSFQTQLRAVSVVAIRDINGQQASLMYGYAWALIDAALSILALLILKLVIHLFNPPGMPPATFILTGALPWYMFVNLYMLPGGAIVRHRKLLAFPVVTELDIVFGASLQILITYAVTFVVTTTISSVIEQVPFPRFPLAIALLFLTCWLMGIFLGLILMPLTRLYPPVSKLIQFVFRFGLFFSSVFFMITTFPSYIWPYLTWNPMLHVGELMRTYWFRTYHSPVGNPVYILECMLGLAAFGLLLERYARNRIPLR